jgi:hypothetical protein
MQGDVYMQVSPLLQLLSLAAATTSPALVHGSALKLAVVLPDVVLLCMKRPRGGVHWCVEHPSFNKLWLAQPQSRERQGLS